VSIKHQILEIANADREQKLSGAQCQDIIGGKRCGITACNGLNDGNDPRGWWVGFSPKNGMNACVEGSWSDWVQLAQQILAEDARRR
jgi:hypothetical protein